MPSTSLTTDRRCWSRHCLGVAAIALLLGACGHDAYYVKLRPRNTQRFNAETMTALESEARRLGLVLLPQHERVVVPGEIYSTLATPEGDPLSLSVVLIWFTDPAPGSPGFMVSVGSRARRGIQEAKPRINEVANHLLRVLNDRFGKNNVSVERDDRKVWIF